MTTVTWEMISCDQGTVALVAKKDLVVRVCFERSPESILTTLSTLYPAARRAALPMIVNGLEQLADYFRGVRQYFALPLDTGSLPDFSRKVLRELTTVPYGTLVSYGELATRVGSPGAARAVGRVMSSNPCPLLVPCHRVVCADGRIGQYSAAHGSVTKAWLIHFERSVASQEACKKPVG
jgi:methylated-DNA-[protein]-cysteine S-methyltransferase